MELTDWLSAEWFDQVAGWLAFSLLGASFLMVFVTLLTHLAQRKQQ